MVSCEVIFDDRVTNFFMTAHTNGCSVSCVKFSKTAVVVLKNSFRN